MQKEIVMAAKTVDEALERAYEQMGATSDETGFEILQMPRRGFLGLKNSPAKVRVYRLEEETVPPPEKKAAPAPVKQTPPPPRREITPQRPAPQLAAKAPVPEKPARAEQKETPVNDSAAAQKLPRAEDAGMAASFKKERVSTPPEQWSDKTRVAVQYIRDILTQMGVKDAVLSAHQTSESIELYLEGDGLGVIIGRRGETLDAVQYLTSLVANRMEGDYVRISIDSGDYRKKRAETLERLATKLARNAVKTGRPTKLEPMNPYERRIIHAAVSRVEGAASSSIGEEPNRRVVISSKNPRKRTEGAPPARDRESAGGSRERGDRGDYGARSGRGPAPGRDRDRRPPMDRAGRSGPHSPAASAQKPVGKLSDSEIEIPTDLAPKRLEPPKPAPVKTVAPQVTAPSEIEKETMPLYGKLDL